MSSQSNGGPAGLRWTVRCWHGLPAVAGWKRRGDRGERYSAVPVAAVEVQVEALGLQIGLDRNSDRWRDAVEVEMAWNRWRHGCWWE